MLQNGCEYPFNNGLFALKGMEIYTMKIIWRSVGLILMQGQGGICSTMFTPSRLLALSLSLLMPLSLPLSLVWFRLMKTSSPVQFFLTRVSILIAV